MSTDLQIYSQELIDRLIAPTGLTPEDLEKKYPPRNLKAGVYVTRFAPSPTGFIHIGGIFSALLSERVAHQSGGICFLRIEDTDQKREMEGGVNLILNALEKFGIGFDEGPISGSRSPEATGMTYEQKGDYGPYVQSEREAIYKTYLRELLKKDLAYPAFDSAAELDEMRKNQEKIKTRTGYYGSFAAWRNKSAEEVEAALKEGKEFVIRFRSPGDFNKKFSFVDAIKGKMEMAENDRDEVIMKSDGLPTYHFAHVVDDHLMRTNLAMRGEEWIPSTPIHAQLFAALSWQSPEYGHFSVISKIDNGAKRKLSKRKDPEANMEFYDQVGFSKEAVLEYLMNLLNSRFENWRMANPDKSIAEFEVKLDNVAKGSPLFDEKKLNDTAKQVVGEMRPEDVLERILVWAGEHDLELAERLKLERDYVLKILNIERDNQTPRQGVAGRRKDLAKWSDLRNSISYFFDDWFEVATGGEHAAELKKLLAENIAEGDAKAAVEKFLAIYDENDSKEIWLEKMKKICADLGYAENVKQFKENPAAYRGNLANIAGTLRILLTGRTFSPDLFEVMRVLGKERVQSRLQRV